MDLLGDISRLPERSALTIILNELGAGLDERGSDLREVIQRANPALQEFDKFLHILESENHTLAKLAEDSDRALAPFAAVRERVADFIVQKQQGGAGDRGAPRRAGSQPAAVPALPGTARPGHRTPRPLRRRTTAALTDQSPHRASTPPSRRARQALEARISRTSARGEGLLPGARGDRAVVEATRRPGGAAKPSPENFATLLTSVRETGGLERRWISSSSAMYAANGYDALGDLRTGGGWHGRVTYQTKPSPGAPQTRVTPAKQPPRRRPRRNRNARVVMARTLAVIKGASPAQARAGHPDPSGSRGRKRRRRCPSPRALQAPLRRSGGLRGQTTAARGRPRQAERGGPRAIRPSGRKLDRGGPLLKRPAGGIGTVPMRNSEQLATGREPRRARRSGPMATTSRPPTPPAPPPGPPPPRRRPRSRGALASGQRGSARSRWSSWSSPTSSSRAKAAPTTS